MRNLNPTHNGTEAGAGAPPTLERSKAVKVLNAIARLVMLVLCASIALKTGSWLFWSLAVLNILLLASWIFLLAADRRPAHPQGGTPAPTLTLTGDAP